MKTFEEIRTTLEKLPDLRRAREHEESYAQLSIVAKKARDELKRVATALPHAASVAAAPEYVKVRKDMGVISKSATRLAEKLKSQPEAVSERSTDAAITKIKEGASTCLKDFQKGWATQISGKARQWKEIATVVSKLGHGAGGNNIRSQALKLTKAIQSLESAATVLPQDGEKASAVQDDLNAISEAVAQLDLETPFGKFLRAAADENRGADLENLQNPEVIDAINKHNLQTSFRVFIT